MSAGFPRRIHRHPIRAAMRCWTKPKSVFASAKSFIGSQTARRSIREIVQVDQCSHFAANRLRMRRAHEPFVKRATLINLEVTKPNPADSFRLDNASYRLANQRKYPSHACMVEKGFIVFDQELIELQIDLRHVGGDPIHIWCDFRGTCHGMIITLRRRTTPPDRGASRAKADDRSMIVEQFRCPSTLLSVRHRADRSCERRRYMRALFRRRLQ
jgi:hypothetical protein